MEELEQVKALIGDHSTQAKTLHKNRRMMPNAITIWYNDESRLDGTRINLSIKAATQGAVAFNWRGSVIAYGHEGWCKDAPGVNLTMSDFRHIVDYFSSHLDPLVVPICSLWSQGSLRIRRRMSIRLNSNLGVGLTARPDPHRQDELLVSISQVTARKRLLVHPTFLWC